MRDDALVIDLASKPGGVDLNAAKEYGVKTVWALSLPGRVAPISAGDIVKQTVLNICAELGCRQHGFRRKNNWLCDDRFLLYLLKQS